MAEQPKNEIKIELTPEVAHGNYANLAVVNFSANEFFLDFIQVTPNMPQARVQSRVIMTPENAKNLLFVLRDHLANYENVFGEITHKEPIAKEPKTPTGGNKFSA